MECQITVTATLRGVSPGLVRLALDRLEMDDGVHLAGAPAGLAWMTHAQPGDEAAGHCLAVRPRAAGTPVTH